MTSLSQFLLDIGAGSLSPTITLPPAGTTKPPLAALHDRVQREIDSINDETQALLEARWAEFSQHVTGGRELVDRIEMEEEELDELEDLLHGEHAFVPPLLAALSSHSALAKAHSEATHTTSALTALTSFAHLITTLASNTTSGSLPHAISSLDAVLALPAPPPWISSLPAWTALVRWSKDEQARLESAVVNALEQCLEFSSSPSKLVFRKWIEAAPGGEELDVPVLLQVLDEVLKRAGDGRKVDAHLARVAKQLLKHFLVPYVEALGQPSTKPQLEFVYVEGPAPGERSVELRPAPTDAPPASSANGRHPYAALETLLAFFRLHSSLLPPSPYAPTFTLHLTPPLQLLILSSHLQPSLPPTIATLPPYLDLLYAAAEFEEDFLLSEGYLAFLPPGEEIFRDEGRVIRDWIALVDVHWARHVGDEALEKVREMIRSEDWEGELVDVQVEIETLSPPLSPPPPPTVVEKKVVEKSPPKQPVLPPVKVVNAPRAPPTPPPEAPRPVRAGKLGTRISKPTPTPPPPPPPPPQAPVEVPVVAAEIPVVPAETPVVLPTPPPIQAPVEVPVARAVVEEIVPVVEAPKVEVPVVEVPVVETPVVEAPVIEAPVVETPVALPVELPVAPTPPSQAPVEIPVDLPAEVTAEIPAEVSVEIPAEVQSEVPAEVPVEEASIEELVPVEVISPRQSVISPPPRQSIVSPPPRQSIVSPPPRQSVVSPPPRASVVSPPPPSSFYRVGTPPVQHFQQRIGTPPVYPQRTSTPPVHPRIGTPVEATPVPSRSSTPLSLSAAFAPPSPTDDEAEDPWGLESSSPVEPSPIAATPSPPKPTPKPFLPPQKIAISPPPPPVPQQPSQATLQLPHARKTSAASIDVDDAWGLDIDEPEEALMEPEPEPEPAPEPVPESPVQAGGDDAWGFGDEDVDEEDADLGQEEDPWGLDDEEAGIGFTPEPGDDLPPPSPELGRSSAHDQKRDSIDGGAWGWEEDTSALDAEFAQSPHFDAPEEVVVVPQPKRASVIGSRIRVEKMMISKRSRGIARIAEEVLVEALELGESGFRYPAFTPAATPLLASFTAILSLYRATAPVHHSKLLLAVPALGIQFANDAEWIGDEIDRTWQRRLQGRTKDAGQANEVGRAVERMRALGAEWRRKQIDTQRKALMDCLDEANRFLYTGEDHRFTACERALAQVTHTLERLSQVWKPVMNPTLFYSTLGGLVNDVLQRVLDEIEDQVDISEEESIRLNKLCKVLHGLESLFAVDNFSVGAEVPIWFKFVFLSEFLEASMADILFLFDHRHLVDFSIDEITRLVRALFADSPMRAKNLEHIMKGHPTTVPDDEDGGSDEDEEAGNGWR